TAVATKASRSRRMRGAGSGVSSAVDPRLAGTSREGAFAPAALCAGVVRGASRRLAIVALDVLAEQLRGPRAIAIPHVLEYAAMLCAEPRGGARPVGERLRAGESVVGDRR